MAILHLPHMLRTVLLILVIGLLTSCKTIHNLASKDISTTRTQSKTRQKGEVKFLDNITVTPENTASANTATSKPQKTNNQQKVNNAKVTATTVSYVQPTVGLSPSTIENAGSLQLKYAIVFDATVEKMTNSAMLKSIDQWWGMKYCLGGNGSDCIDCSAFTKSVVKDVYGLDLPRTAHEQYDVTQRIEIEELQEGDLVFFYTSGRRISHVGIYIMNNKFVHAATSQGVSVSDLNDAYWKDRYRGAGRLMRSSADSTVTGGK